MPTKFLAEAMEIRAATKEWARCLNRHGVASNLADFQRASQRLEEATDALTNREREDERKRCIDAIEERIAALEQMIAEGLAAKRKSLAIMTCRAEAAKCCDILRDLK